MNLFKSLNRFGSLVVAAALSATQRIAESMNPTRLSVVPPQDIARGLDERSQRRVYQRPLTGLEIRAVRKAGHAFPTRRTNASRYMPNGVPARVSKAVRALNVLSVQA